MNRTSMTAALLAALLAGAAAPSRAQDPEVKPPESGSSGSAADPAVDRDQAVPKSDTPSQRIQSKHRSRPARRRGDAPAIPGDASKASPESKAIPGSVDREGEATPPSGGRAQPPSPDAPERGDYSR